MRLSYLRLFLIIGVFLVLGEFLLEVRASHRGFSTLFFGRVEAVAVPSTSADGSGGGDSYGPNPQFPFRSRVVARNRPAGVRRIWLASTSYAAGLDTPPNLIFPVLLGDTLTDRYGIPVEIINASSSGFTVADNIEELTRTAPEWHPDIVLLYQMTNDLSQLSRLLLGSGAGGDAIKRIDSPASPKSHRSPIRFFERVYESSTVFALTSANLTPLVSQYRPLPDQLPPSADSVFTARVRRFVHEARRLGARPILSTLPISQILGAPLTRARRFWMLRWTPDLSPTGYVHTVQHWNDLIRALGPELGVSVVDVARDLGGNALYFEDGDVVHYTRAGHGAIASDMARQLAPMLRTVTSGR